jgi:hypothetical protein
MNKGISIIIFCLTFCLSTFLFLRYDSKRAEYGWECDFCNKSIPFGLKAKEYNSSYVLLNEDEFELVGIGFRYETTNFKIKDFLAYGYNDTSIVVKCTDSINTIKYLTSYETGYKSKKGNPEISFKDLSNRDLEQIKAKYNWVVFNQEEAQKVTFKRFLSAIGALLSLILIIWRLIQI